MSKSSANISFQDLLKPELLNSVRGLELLSRMVMDSFLHGANRSLRSGLGQEFKQYRSYQPGDDLRHLDWKMYARSDRFFIREAEVESNLQVRFVIDNSASMGHQDNRSLSKSQYARLIAATLGHLALHQGDEIALYTLNQEKVQDLSPRGGKNHFKRFLHQLLEMQAQAQYPSDIRNHIVPRKAQKEMLIFISDFYQKEQEIIDSLQLWQGQKSEVLAIHILADNEQNLSYTQNYIFEDLESKKQVAVDIQKSKAAYQKNLASKLQQIESELLGLGIFYQLYISHEELAPLLSSFLKRRLKSL